MGYNGHKTYRMTYSMPLLASPPTRGKTAQKIIRNDLRAYTPPHISVYVVLLAVPKTNRIKLPCQIPTYKP
jgi:hypothetical protein